MATIYIDNQPHEVKDGQNLLQACLTLGFNVPFFCWHPALNSVGACRLCAVKQFRDENDARGRIVMSCMTPATDGTRISIDDEEVNTFRAQVLEWLMTNHPHDCPVCDEGGECHLQDMTVMTGHNYRSYRFTKRTYTNQDLGPFVNHEMNRCIQCYRCARFYADYAGGHDLAPMASHNHTYFGRHADGPLESEFSGNLVEVCPTGVFTDKTLKAHNTRRWDQQTAPSVCVHCGVGCNTIPGERYGTLRRIRNRYNGEVNGYFLCDRGRYGYEFVNGDRRIRAAYRRQHDAKIEMPREEALAWIGDRLNRDKTIIGIGSPRASLESNFALRTLTGPEHFYQGVPEHEARLVAKMIENLQQGPARSPSLQDMADADAVLVLGEDLTNAAPMMALSLRQAVRQAPMKAADKLSIPRWNDDAVRTLLQDAKGPLYIAATRDTRLDEVATETHVAAPDDIARLGFAVAHAIDPASPAPSKLAPEAEELASRIAMALQTAKQPLVVSGPSCKSEAVIAAAANVAWALCRSCQPAALAYVMPECNTMGLALLGGQGLEKAIDAIANGAADTVIVLENDLYRRIDRAQADALFAKAKTVIALDHIETETTAKATAVLPAATFAESDGIYVNGEGRAQRFVQVYAPKSDIADAWRWLRRVRDAAGRAGGNDWVSLDDLVETISKSVNVFHDVPSLVPSAATRFVGQKIARQPHRYSGRTAMYANIDVSESQVPEDPDSPMSFSMEGYRGRRIPTALRSWYWSPGWNSPQVLSKFQEEVGGALRGGDPGLRLIEADPNSSVAYQDGAPAAFTPRSQEMLLVAMHHIYGSEEMSALSPSIAGRAPAPYIAMSPRDAARLGVTQNDRVEIAIGSFTSILPVDILSRLPVGVAGLPEGLRGAPRASLPAWATVRKEAQP